MTNNSQWGRCYLDHYEKYLGEPVESVIFAQEESRPTIQVLSYDGVFSGCRVFASLGLSHYSREVASVAEAMLIMDEGWSDGPRLLANTLFYMVQKSLPMRSGIAVGGMRAVSSSFAEEFEKEAFYWTEPFGFPPEFSVVPCADAPGFGRMWMALPLSSAEFELLQLRGVEELESVLEAGDIDPYAPRRRSVV